MITGRTAKYITTILVALLALCSCAKKVDDTGITTVEEQSVIVTPAPTPWSYINRHVLAHVDNTDYTVAPMNLDLSYDDLVSTVYDYVGIDENEHDYLRGEFTHGDYTEEYTEYLEFCELLGLPTSDEATQLILGQD